MLGRNELSTFQAISGPHSAQQGNLQAKEDHSLNRSSSAGILRAV